MKFERFSLRIFDEDSSVEILQTKDFKLYRLCITESSDVRIQKVENIDIDRLKLRRSAWNSLRNRIVVLSKLKTVVDNLLLVPGSTLSCKSFNRI